MNNSLMVLECYRHGGTWVFDDERVDLAAEPFVAGIPEIIDDAVIRGGGEIKHAYDQGIYLTFGTSPFPGHTVELTWITHPKGTHYFETSDPSGNTQAGNWYVCEQTKETGWLCPALFKYFERAPVKLYGKAEVCQ